jgi:hypothetical protein
MVFYHVFTWWPDALFVSRACLWFLNLLWTDRLIL